MKKFFKNPIVITALVLIGLGLLFWGGSAIYNSNNEKALQMALDNVNGKIKKASASRGANLDSLISEREALIEIIKVTNN